jgi:hypothetical protein
MYGVQTPVVSVPLTPKAPLNAYIWGRKFETCNSVQYFDIIFVPCKFFSLNLSKRAKLKGCVILRREIDGDWLKKTLCVEHQNTRDRNLNTRDRNLNTRDRNIFQNERVKIANPCVLDSTHSDLSVFVSR